MSVLTSKLIVELLDRLTGPARRMNGALNSLTAAGERNSMRIAALQGKLLGAAATGYALARSLAAPIKAGAEFQSTLEDIRQKADLSGPALAGLGSQIRSIAAATNQLPTETLKTFDALLGLGLGGATDQENVDAALAMLPAINKVATAYRAASEDVMRAGQSVFQNLKVPAGEMLRAFDAMAQAGKEGAFELKNMSREFPSLTAGAQSLGMSGVTAVARLAAVLQIAHKGAGSASEAATNTANLMQKIIAPEAVAKFKKAGIDIRAELKKTQDAGGDVFEMVDRLLKKATKGDQAKIVDFFADKQVLEFLRPLWQNIDEYKRIRDKALQAQGVVAGDYAERIKTADAAITRFKGSIEELNISLSAGLLPTFTWLLDNGVNPLVKRLGEFAKQHPDLTKWTVGTTAGLIALRVAGIAAKFGLGWLWGGGLMVARGALLALGVAGGPVSLMLTTLASAAVYAYTHWDEVLKLWQRLKEPWGELRAEIEKTRAAMAAPWSDLGEKAQATGEKVTGPWKKLGDTLSGTKDLLLDPWRRMFGDDQSAPRLPQWATSPQITTPEQPAFPPLPTRKQPFPENGTDPVRFLDRSDEAAAAGTSTGAAFRRALLSEVDAAVQEALSKMAKLKAGMSFTASPTIAPRFAPAGAGGGSSEARRTASYYGAHSDYDKGAAR